MGKIASRLKATIAELAAEEKQAAIRHGELYDAAHKFIAAVDDVIDDPIQPKALAPSRSGRFRFRRARGRMTKAWLAEFWKLNKHRLTTEQRKGVTAAKDLGIQGFMAWLNERGLDAAAAFEQAQCFPSPYQLLAYWRGNGSPLLSDS